MNTIAERLLRVRGKTKQGDFAKALGINPNTLRTYENGRSLPNQEILEKICVQFSVSPAWLLLGVGPMRETLKDSAASSQEKAGYGLQVGDGSIAKWERELELEREERRELAAETRRLYREKEELHREKEQLLREKEDLLRTLGELSAKLALMEGRMEAARGETEQEEQPLRFDKKQAIPSSSHTLPTHK